MKERVGNGHAFAVIPGGRLDAWGAGPLLIRSGRRKWFFEFSEMFGPLWLREKDFGVSDRQPMSEINPFWWPFDAWLRGGRKVRAVRTKCGRVKYWVCHWPRGLPLPRSLGCTSAAQRRKTRSLTAPSP
jgi:hypothetical protein